MKGSLQGRQAETSLQASRDRIGEYLDVLLKMLPEAESHRYLDIGCGLGQSLEVGAECGLDVAGVESSRECVEIVRSRGLRVWEAGDPEWSRRQYELISFWESLEHVANPFEVLQRCLSCLAPRGLLAFTVPNLDSPLVRTQRQDCSFVHGGYDTPGHINLFGPSAISSLLSRSGFSLLVLDGQYGLNLSELVSYLTGRHRGAFDLMNGVSVQSALPSDCEALLTAIGPAYALFERVSLTSPILFGVACRDEDFEFYRAAAASYFERRERQVLDQARALDPGGSEDELTEIREIAEARVTELEALRASHAEALGKIAALEERVRLEHTPLSGIFRYFRSQRDSRKD